MHYLGKKLSITYISLTFIFSALLSIVGSGLYAYAALPSSSGAKVSFTFDDGLTSSLLAAQTLQKYGYTATNYIVTDCVGLEAGAANNNCAASPDYDYMTWQEIVSLQNDYKWEIGSHTVSHPLITVADNPALTAGMLDNELSQSQNSLKLNGLTGLNFAAPYGAYDNRSVAIAAKYYASFRAFHDLTYSTETDVNKFPYFMPRSSYPYNNYMLTVLQVQGNVSLDIVKGYIDQAKLNNQWLILVLHEIKADNDITYDASLEAYQYKAGDLASIADYIKTQAVPVVNINDGLVSGTNLMISSTFNNGVADGWTTDSPTGIIADKQSTSQLGHGSYDGTPLGPLNSIYLKGSTVDTHLFSPKINVAFGSSYVLKNFVNVLSNSGEIAFYIDEYNSAGEDLKSGKYIHGVVGSNVDSALQVGNVNFVYTPSSANVASARLQVIVHGLGTEAYVDNLEWLLVDGQIVPPIAVAGDVNGDGLVDALDLSVVLNNWNANGLTKTQGDLNVDGVVDALDLSTILGNWSK